jgi:hypothetical protein
MWKPTNIEKRSAELDLSSSGQGRVKVSQIVLDGHVLCNAYEAIDWADQPLQFQLCEACLIPRCGGGGCVALRRVDEFILITPDFRSMLGGDWESTEYAPPRIITRHGAVCLSSTQWRQLCAIAPGVPSFESISLLGTDELIYLFYFQTPGAFLHDFLHPAHAAWDNILCTNGSNSEADIAFLKCLFSAPTDFSHHERSKPAKGSFPISVFLETTIGCEWKVFTSDTPPLLWISDDLQFHLHRVK